MRIRFSQFVCLALSLLMTGAAVAQTSVTKPKDIVDTAVESKKLETLVKVLKASGLTEKLKAKGPYTVLAPSEAAFKKIPEDQLKALLLPENKTKLQGLLKFHVLPGKLMAADVAKLKKSKTAQGQHVAFEIDGETVTVNGAKIVKSDIECGNGVIHLIDTVLMPKQEAGSRSASETNRTPEKEGTSGG